MNEEELARNSVATDYAVHDLNVDPRLPYEDNSFDVVTNAVSVDCALLTVAFCPPPLLIAKACPSVSPRVGHLIGPVMASTQIMQHSVS